MTQFDNTAKSNVRKDFSRVCSLFSHSFSFLIIWLRKYPLTLKMHLLRYFMHKLELWKCVLYLLVFGKCNDETLKIVISLIKVWKILKIGPASFSHSTIPLKQVILRWLIKQVQLLVQQRSEISLAWSSFYEVAHSEFSTFFFLFSLWSTLDTIHFSFWLTDRNMWQDLWYFRK